MGDKRFSSKEDCVVLEGFGKYTVNDIIPAGTIYNTGLIKLWLDGKVDNLLDKCTEATLQQLSFKELKKVGAKLGVTDRSRKKLVVKILSAQ